MKRAIFLGQRQIAWRALEILARPENRRHISIEVFVTDRDTYDRAANAFDLSHAHFISNEHRSTDEILAAMTVKNVELLISIQHNWILSKNIIQSVRDNAFNLHNARLPHYQGYNSVSHAILNNDQEYYSTIHWMTDEVDAGSIAFEEITPISPADTAMSLHHKTIDAAVRAFEKLLRCIREDLPIPRIGLPDVVPKFYGKNSLRELMDVTSIQDHEQLDRLSRALFYVPYNVAYKIVNNKKLLLIPETGLEALRHHGLTAL
jgi:methionyl-tRNA formyltransferase